MRTSGEHYVLKEEARKYCHNDTRILAKSALIFRHAVLELSNGACDPLVGKSVTLAGMVTQIYRSVFMPKKSIGIMPWVGYGWVGRQQSILALKYFEYENKQWLSHGECKILHAGNNPSGEIIIGGYKVDGMSENRDEAFEVW